MLSFLRIVACEVSIVTYFTGYMLAEKGFLCSDIGKNSIDDVKSCEAALNVIQKVNPDVGTDVIEGNFQNQPKGCLMLKNIIYFNTASTDLPSLDSRQVCKGKLQNKGLLKLKSILVFKFSTT